MSDMDMRFSPAVREILSASISEAGGNEVFAACCLDGEGCITTITIAARGHQSAVPVIRSAAENAEVLVHNHPSGNLTPSDADLNIASQAAESGLGFYIVNNDVTDVYVVVEPVLSREKVPLDPEYVSALLDETGPLAQNRSDYEERPSQLQLTKEIAASFNEGSIRVFEAGTGVGKSYAYLLPAMQWALQNKDRVVVSTGTINLQQQLIDKDIPRAIEIIGQPIKAVLIKGRQNYVCLRRLQEAVGEASIESDFFEDETEELRRIQQWAETTSDGSRSDLTFMPREEVWSRVCSESDACMGMRCSRHEECFVMRVRKEAASASLLIVNHHLLFADLEVRMAGVGYDDTAVLPPFHHIVFDEAHSMEGAATSFFSEYFTRFKVLKQLSLLYRVRRSSVAGHLISLERLSSSAGEVQEALAAVQEIKASYSDAEDCAMRLLGDASTWRLCSETASAASELFPVLSKLRGAVSVFTGVVRTVLEGIAEEDQDDPIVWESKFALRRIEFIGSLCQNFCEWSERPESVFWIEKKRLANRSPRGDSSEPSWYPRFVQTPLSIAPMMLEGVFEPFRTVVCTSATLRIADSFDYWLRRVGVTRADPQRIRTGIFDSPFPYARNVLLGIPTDSPLPDSPEFQLWAETAIISLLQASGGHTLVLFTSYESLRSACEAARRVLSPLGMQILRQGDDDRFRLLEAFKTDESSVLFATDSFWEGVDAPGDALLQVIMVKLPFRVPNDPVHAARSEAISLSGGNPFMELSVPEAVVRFRQGFGRLMRRKTDRGSVVVLDRRLLAKRYGAVFLQSIPETAVCFDSMHVLSDSIERFIYR